MVIATEKLAALCREVARSYGLPQTRIVVVPHPLGGTPPERLQAWADTAIDTLVARFLGSRAAGA